MRKLSHHLACLALCALASCVGGGEPEPEPLPFFTWGGFWASGADDIWVVGGLPAPTHGSGVVHYDGLSWSLVEHFDGFIRQVSGSGPDDVWLLEVQSTGWEEHEYHWYRGSLAGFEEHALPPVPTLPAVAGDTYRFLGGARDDVWLVTLMEDEDNSDWVGDLRIWRHDGAAWTDVTVSPVANLRRDSLKIARDGEGWVWLAGRTGGGGGPLLLQRWSAETGWVSVDLPPEVVRQPSLQVDSSGRLHLLSTAVYRYEESGWTVVSDPVGEGVRGFTGRTVTSYGIWTVEHSGSNTSCENIFSCGRTTTDLSRGVVRLDRMGEPDFMLPIDGSCGAGQCFVQEDPDVAWMITTNRVRRLDLR